jgi:hypothetical protein
MLTNELRQLPYLVHTNRELGLMLSGIKPLAYFLAVAGREPDCLVRYWRMFDRHVATGRLIKGEFVEPIPEMPDLELRRIFYALPGEKWRIEAMRELLTHLGEWSRDHERRQGELLGYEDWQNDYWIARCSPRAKN